MPRTRLWMRHAWRLHAVAHRPDPLSTTESAELRWRRRGESDGVSTPGAPRYDPKCGAFDAWTGAPQAGEWFHEQFVYMVENASPPLSRAPKYMSEMRPDPPFPPWPPPPPPSPPAPLSSSPSPAAVSDNDWFAMQQSSWLSKPGRQSSLPPPPPTSVEQLAESSWSGETWTSSAQPSSNSEVIVSSAPPLGADSAVEAAPSPILQGQEASEQPSGPSEVSLLSVVLIVGLLLWTRAKGSPRDMLRTQPIEVPSAAYDEDDDVRDYETDSPDDENLSRRSGRSRRSQPAKGLTSTASARRSPGGCSPSDRKAVPGRLRREQHGETPAARGRRSPQPYTSCPNDDYAPSREAHVGKSRKLPSAWLNAWGNEPPSQRSQYDYRSSTSSY